MTKKRIVNTSFIALLIFCSLLIGWSYKHKLNISTNPLVLGQPENINPQPKSSADQNNYEIIQQKLSQILSDYNNLGYFPQIYIPSLRATYYALNVLANLDKLDEINQTEVKNFIMSCYNDTEHRFADIYSKRFLDTNYSVFYYPLYSVLETNCYAILALELIGQLTLINTKEFIDFIWSCFNPEGAANGFIGQPYNSELMNMAKVATIDNTYYAVLTLSHLINDWSAYSAERLGIVQYINALQSAVYPYGFNNDFDSNFESIDLYEPNIISSYYSLMTLEIFDMIDTIRIEDFHQYLSCLYHLDGFYFDAYQNPFIINITNVRATAIGLELADLTGFTDVNREGIINFLLNKKNTQGGWYTSTRNENYELWDTFQVIVSLRNCNELKRLTSNEKDDISFFISNFDQYNGGFSLISKDYMSADLLHTIISTFTLYDRISDLDISGIYNYLRSTYREVISDVGFQSLIPVGYNFGYPYSFPIEYYCIGTKKNSQLFSLPISHISTFKVLESLLKIFKLDDFNLLYDLNLLLPNILESQVLDVNSEAYGSFTPFYGTHPIWHKEFYHFDYTFYAIKSLELLTNYLLLGNLTDLPFNKVALRNYLEKNTVETNSTIFFRPNYTNDPEITLKYTYYMIYLLKALKYYNLNNQKINNFVLLNLNYSNIENVYYSYKISELLDLDINFDHILINALITNLYSSELKEFYIGTDFQAINQETLLWISEMAVNSKIEIDCSYHQSLILGKINPISVSFHNLVLSQFGQDTSVKFESDLGIVEFEYQSDNTFRFDFLTQEKSEFFPLIRGYIKIYQQSRCIGQLPLSFETKINHVVQSSIIRQVNNFQIEINISRKFMSGFYPVPSSTMVVDVLKDDEYFDTIFLDREDFQVFSRFHGNYQCNLSGEYRFNYSIFDEFYPNGYLLTSERRLIPHPPPEIMINSPFIALSALGSSIFLTLLIYKVGTLRKGKLKRKAKTQKPETVEQDHTSAHEANEEIKKRVFRRWD